MTELELTKAIVKVLDNKKAMDINQDGEFTVIDITMMSRYILGIETNGSYAGNWINN